MTNNKLVDYYSIINNNELILKLYERLAELEYLKKKGNNDYNLTIEMIKDYVNKNDELYKKHSINDDDIFNFSDMIDDVKANTNFEFIDNFDKRNTAKKEYRFINFLGILNLLNTKFDKEDLLYEFYDYPVRLNGVVYSMDNFLEIMKEYGYGASLGVFEQLKDEFARKKYEELIVENRKYLIYEKLENSTILDYIDNAIENIKGKVLRKKLIDAKYSFIALHKDLEDSFLLDQNNYSKTSMYQQSFKYQFKKDDPILVSFNNSLIEALNDTIVMITERNKKKYKNANDQFTDILLSIYVKSYTSLLISYKDIANIKLSSEYLLNENKNDINKKLIEQSLDLEPNLILSRKL